MRKFIHGLIATLAAAPMAAAAIIAGAPTGVHVASAEDNGVGQTPALGWSSWSFIRRNPTAAKIEAQADAMQSSGLAQVGFTYVNLDDFPTTSRSPVPRRGRSTPTAAALGLPAGTDYFLNDLWTHHTTETAGAVSANVPSHGVALYRVSPDANPTAAPPNATIAMTGLSTVTAGQPVTATETFTDNGDLAALHVNLGLHVPSGWSVTPTSPTSFPAVETGQTVQATFQVVAPQSASLFQSDTVTSSAGYTWAGKTPQNLSVDQTVRTNSPVQPPYQTYSSAADAQAAFAQSGQAFGIQGAGADLYTSSDSYSTIYLKGAVGTASTIETEVVSQQNMNGFAKAGLIVRNDMTGSGTTPEGVILFESPSGGFQLEWDNNGGTRINSVTPPNGTIPSSLPVWLRLVKNGAAFTGYYSTDGGSTWTMIGTATVPAQADTQDAGMFMVSHAAGSLGEVTFQGFSVQ